MDVVALSDIKHNGQRYTEGELIQKIKKADGDRLISIGVAKLINADDEDAESPKGDEKEKPDIKKPQK